MFSACTTYEKQLRIEKTRLSHQVWSHGGSTFKKRTLNGHFSCPVQTDPNEDVILKEREQAEKKSFQVNIMVLLEHDIVVEEDKES